MSEPEIGPNGLPVVPRRLEPEPVVSAAAAPARPRERPLGPALSSMGLGFFALILGPVLGVPAIVMGVAGRSRAKPGSAARTQATTGIVLGLVGTAWWTVALVALL